MQIEKAVAQMTLLIPYIKGAIECNKSSHAVPVLETLQKEIIEIAQLLAGENKADDPDKTPINNWVVNDSALTHRTSSCLIAERIVTVGELLSWCEHQLLRTPNLGKKSLNEIKVQIKAAGYELASRKTIKFEHGQSKCQYCELEE